MKVRFNNNWDDPGSNDRLDLVFENRFTGYGAYVLRRQYVRNKVLAMVITFGGIGILSFLPRLLANPAERHLKTKPPKPDSTICVYYAPTDPPEWNRPKHSSGGGSSSAGIPDFDPSAPPVSSFSLDPKLFGNGQGNGDTGDIPYDGGFGSTGGGSQPKGQPAPRKPDHDCEFRGGIDAFSSFIRENFVNPAVCADELEGYAVVRFLVNIDGHISDVQIVESTKSCPAFAEEVKRVVRMSPNWKPASAGGSLVKCYRQVPVRLKLE